MSELGPLSTESAGADLRLGCRSIAPLQRDHLDRQYLHAPHRKGSAAAGLATADEVATRECAHRRDRRLPIAAGRYLLPTPSAPAALGDTRAASSSAAGNSTTSCDCAASCDCTATINTSRIGATT